MRKINWGWILLIALLIMLVGVIGSLIFVGFIIGIIIFSVLLLWGLITLVLGFASSLLFSSLFLLLVGLFGIGFGVYYKQNLYIIISGILLVAASVFLILKHRKRKKFYGNIRIYRER